MGGREGGRAHVHVPASECVNEQVCECVSNLFSLKGGDRISQSMKRVFDVVSSPALQKIMMGSLVRVELLH